MATHDYDFNSGNFSCIVSSSSIGTAYYGLASTASDNKGWHIRHNSGQTSFVHRYSGTECNGPVPTSIGVLHSYASVKSGTSLTPYLGSVAATPVVISATTTNDGPGLVLGAYRATDTANNLLAGSINCVQIWNRALSASEVAYLNAFPFCMFDPPGFGFGLGPGTSQVGSRIVGLQ